MRARLRFSLCWLAFCLGASSALQSQEQDINAKVAQITIGRSSLEDVIRVFGEPVSYLWGKQTFTRDKLPSVYIATYPNKFSVVMSNGIVIELRFEGPGFLYLGKLQVGSSLQEIFDVVGPPSATVTGEPLPQQAKDGVLYADIGGRMGYCYYPRRDLGVRFFLWESRVSALYLTAKQGLGAVLTSLPSYNPDSPAPFQVDLRSADLSRLDLRARLNDLLYADFDDKTIWPSSDKMPPEFDWRRVMELGRNPGLGIRSLHDRGLTGRGVAIALIDNPLLVTHQEYADRLRFYQEINRAQNSSPNMHGSAVVSIAAGKTVGVAPEADIYYMAAWVSDQQGANFKYRAECVRRILKINEQLPQDKKIRVISMSVGWDPTQAGYEEMTVAANEAKAAGMLFVSSSIERVHGFRFQALGRFPLADPDAFESYEPGLFWAKAFYAGNRFSDRLLAPMDSRTTASERGNGVYVFYRMGGWSWTIPYIAGVYALAVQADPAITPERFWSLAMKTGRTIELKYRDETISFGPIIDPVALIRELRPD
jgi:hypothetical protein